MQRVGRKNDPAFRIVVCEKRSKPQTSGIEMLGSYHPKTKQLILKGERITYWRTHGAQVSDTVRQLLSRPLKNNQHKGGDKTSHEATPALIAPP